VWLVGFLEVFVGKSMWKATEPFGIYGNDEVKW